MKRTLWLLLDYTARAIIRRLDALITHDDDDEPQNVAGWVVCPDCGETVPIGLAPIQLDTNEDGQQVANSDLQMDDVWAHAWTHENDNREATP